jgi:sigma-B regulation protein RsbU (phosphoserine phosphatase)
MKEEAPSQVLVCVREVAALAEYRRVLAGGGLEVAGHLFESPDPSELEPYQLILIGGFGRDGEALSLCRRLRCRLDDRFIPILFITDDPSATMRLAALEAGADTYLFSPFASGELMAQVDAFFRIKEIHDRLVEKTAEVHRINRKLQQAYQQIDQELALAQRIQSSFLPRTLPQVPRSRFAVHYLLKDRVGGDFYDVFRLDEHHVGFYVADAMGHGVPASLLTIFVKKGVRTKEVQGKTYRLIPPDEVLGGLNHDLIEQRLSENPFITMVYGLFNHRDYTLTFARAGHPYPLYIPRQGDLQLWRQEGLLLGVVDARFPASTYAVEPGDKILLYSDGIDSAVQEGCEPGIESLLACAEHHRALPVAEFVPRLARDLFGANAQPDDLTLLGLEVSES